MKDEEYGTEVGVPACHVSASSAPGSVSTAMSAARAGGVTRQKRSESCSTNRIMGSASCSS